MDEKQWEWQELKTGVLFSRKGLKVQLMPQRGSLLVSGDIMKALQFLDLDIPILGMKGLAGNNFALAIGSNRILVSTQKQLQVRNGWFKDGFIITSADFQWKLLALEGPTARMVLAQGILNDLSSPSCITLVFGKTSLVVKSATGYLLFVEAPYLQYLIDCLDSCDLINTGV